jgi:excisionase family DNA binding protein
MPKMWPIPVINTLKMSETTWAGTGPLTIRLNIAPLIIIIRSLRPTRVRLAFSPDEVAATLGISRDLVYDLLRTGQLQSVKAGRRRLISRRHVEDFLAGGGDQGL